MTEHWLIDCFRNRSRVNPAAYQPQMFLGLKFCATQVQAGELHQLTWILFWNARRLLDVGVRSYIEDEAVNYGGSYTADLRRDHNTHLIAVVRAPLSVELIDQSITLSFALSGAAS